MAHNIFRASDAQPLKAANHLGDYEAIIIELTWPKLVGVNGPAPGYKASVDYPLIKEVEASLRRRTMELLTFLAAGGVAAVKARARSVLAWSNAIGTQTADVNTDAWLIDAIPPLGANYYEPFEVGAGTSISVREPGHPLDEAIRNATGYSALLRDRVFEREGPLVLATSRIGGPIAAEIAVGRGLVFLLPSGIDDVTLAAALSQLLDDRARYRSAWMLPRERELLVMERKLREALQGEVKKLEGEMEELASVRAAVMKDVHVARAIAYYENGVSATRDVKHAMNDLYKLAEMLEAQLGGSEDALASALGVPKARFKHIKKLANQKELDFRHATSGEPVGADAADIQQAREDARELVQKFIEHRCAEEIGRGVAAKTLPATGRPSSH